MSATMIDARSSGVQRLSEQSHKVPPRLHGRILVADDSSDGRRTMSNILRCMGLKVEVADVTYLARQYWSPSDIGGGEPEGGEYVVRYRVYCALQPEEGETAVLDGQVRADLGQC